MSHLRRIKFVYLVLPIALCLSINRTNPSRQRRCAVLTRSANAATRLRLRRQAERKAATAAQSGETK